MPNLTFRKCEPDNSSGNKSDIICKESFFARVCGTEVSSIFRRHILLDKIINYINLEYLYGYNNKI